MTWLRGVALLLAFGISVAVMFPLRVAWSAAAPPADLVLTRVDGTIWNGRLTRVEWRGVALGDFDVSMQLLDLLPRPALRLENGSGPLRSAVVRGGADAIQITDATISVALAGLAAAAPSELVVQITDGALTLRESRCTHASGQVTSPAAPSLAMSEFSGRLSCDRGAILAHLSSETENVVFEISLGMDRIAYRSASPSLEAAFAAIGIPRADNQP